MSDRSFAVMMTVLLLALATAEVAYGIFGPITGRPLQMHEFSSRNRAH